MLTNLSCLDGTSGSRQNDNGCIFREHNSFDTMQRQVITISRCPPRFFDSCQNRMDRTEKAIYYLSSFVIALSNSSDLTGDEKLKKENT